MLCSPYSLLIDGPPPRRSRSNTPVLLVAPHRKPQPSQHSLFWAVTRLRSHSLVRPGALHSWASACGPHHPTAPGALHSQSGKGGPLALQGSHTGPRLAYPWGPNSTSGALARLAAAAPPHFRPGPMHRSTHQGRPGSGFSRVSGRPQFRLVPLRAVATHPHATLRQSRHLGSGTTPATA
ncbi:hypothetical protein NDU88_003027 [Pleurodeles waltl]|uniref:Uncharacterized protein n=1 Tax=Pleurodeles waltl TaxID=8319 RepID=A0AAV7WMV7_PLEWA|nr:hypothetical protein NDU88_003027 [Pleurodeles waltl]